MKLVRARFGEHLDAAKSKLVVLSGIRVLIDANFANRRLRRQLPAGEAVDVNLAAIRPGSRPSQRAQLRRQLIRIIRQRIQILAADDGSAGVRIRIGAQRDRVCFHVHDRRLLTNLQLRIERGARDRRNLQPIHRVGSEAGHRHDDRVGAWRDRNAVAAVTLRLCLDAVSLRGRQHDGRAGDRRAVGVGHRSVQLCAARGDGLRTSGGATRRRLGCCGLCR